MKIIELRRNSLDICIQVINLVINHNSNIDLINELQMTKFRIKSAKSIKEKMNKLNIKLENIYDLIGIRFVFNSVEECYKLLENITNIEDLKVLQIRDYIKSPKDLDEYKALHIHFKYSGYLGEIQIMDSSMNKLDEKTHDDYKKGLLNITN